MRQIELTAKECKLLVEALNALVYHEPTDEHERALADQLKKKLTAK
jgi:hypothetical protein